jgi:hypothetical protein
MAKYNEKSILFIRDYVLLGNGFLVKSNHRDVTKHAAASLSELNVNITFRILHVFMYLCGLQWIKFVGRSDICVDLNLTG